MNIFKELVFSTWNFKAYKQFIQNKGGKVFGFSMLLFFIYALISTVIPMLTSVNPFNNEFAQMIEEEVPEFILEDGILQMDGRFVHEDSKTYILINTEESLNLDAIEDVVRSKQQVILMDAEKIAIKDKGERNIMYFDEVQEAFGIDRLTKDDLYALVPFFNTIMVIVTVVVILGQMAAFYLRILVVSLIALIAASVSKVKLPYGRLFKLSVYTRTVPVAFRALFSLLNFSFPLFFLVDLLISGLYAYFALQEIKKDIVPPQSYYYAANGMGPQM